MDEIKKIERPDLEHYYELLLKQFKALRQGSLNVKLEEERIELALSRISWGNYRLCMECWKDIGDKRLKADPTALFCPSCLSG